MGWIVTDLTPSTSTFSKTNDIRRGFVYERRELQVKLEAMRSPEIRAEFFWGFRRRGTWSLAALGMREHQAMTATRSHDSRFFATARPDECPACHGGTVVYWLRERARGHSNWHRDTQDDGEVRMWSGMQEIASCLPEHNRDLTGRLEH